MWSKAREHRSWERVLSMCCSPPCTHSLGRFDGIIAIQNSPDIMSAVVAEGVCLHLATSRKLPFAELLMPHEGFVVDSADVLFSTVHPIIASINKPHAVPDGELIT